MTIVRPIGGSGVTCKLESEDNEGEVGKISPVAGESSSVGGEIMVAEDDNSKDMGVLWCCRDVAAVEWEVEEEELFPSWELKSDLQIPANGNPIKPWLPLMDLLPLNCMEAGLAGNEGQTSHGSKSNSTFQSRNSRKKSYFSGGNGDRDGESKRKQTEESFQRVMYMSCWTQGC
ncbi:hypothetical protein SADUNF_Sadunf11G0023200 [Salix dunnii]|uniref:Uncharacterized protein n=1 Tax=Salix dunnii TaxID=1413687 RepID=A0A835MWM2_9ROSI|nr:hypothetical protein SADUNF_Sadunf11G0023200 [Salix dunnii]